MFKTLMAKTETVIQSDVRTRTLAKSVECNKIDLVVREYPGFTLQYSVTTNTV